MSTELCWPISQPSQQLAKGLVPVVNADQLSEVCLALLHGVDENSCFSYTPRAISKGERLYFALDEGLSVEYDGKPCILDCHTIVGATITRCMHSHGTRLSHLVALRFDTLDSEEATIAHPSCQTYVTVAVNVYPVILRDFCAPAGLSMTQADFKGQEPVATGWRIIAPILGRSKSGELCLGISGADNFYQAGKTTMRELNAEERWVLDSNS